MAPRATLATVARHAKVSLATASKVLNGRDGVSEETRRRVQEAIIALGYRPTTARADDPCAAVRRVNVIFRELDSTMYGAQVLNAMLVAAAEFRMELIPRLLDQPVSTERVDAWARMLLGGGAQGAIIVAADLSAAQVVACWRIGLPIVAIDSYTPPDVADFVSVGSNNFAGGYSAATHLLSLGHRRLGLIRGPEGASFARERAFGFLAALTEAEVSIPDSLIIVEPFDYDGGVRAGRVMLDRPERPTAIAANCDASAIGVMEAARQLDLRVPADLSVIGFDDTKLAQWSTPQLTTVSQELRDIARVALRMMGRMLDGQEPDSPHVQLATKLIVRGSTAALVPGVSHP